MNFILSELGATGSVDGDNKLVIKGRFQQKQIESVLKAYIREYVTCHTCRSPNTILTKENRLFFLQCEVRWELHVQLESFCIAVGCGLSLHYFFIIITI